MVPVTRQAHDWLRTKIPPGGRVVDATAGNGHDTLFLAQLVGPDGRVFAVDIQLEALVATKSRLGELMDRVTLVEGDHAELGRHIPTEWHGRVDAVVFNLGYLPGGDKQVITRAPSTLAALRQSLAILKEGGALCVVAYPAHPGGSEEVAIVRDWFESQRATGHVALVPDPTGPDSIAPQLFRLTGCGSPRDAGLAAEGPLE